MLRKLKEYKKVFSAVVTYVKNPHMYFLDMLGILKRDWIFKTDKGKLIVRPNSSDKWIALENLVFNQFEFERFDGQFDTVIDLGANMGASALTIYEHFKQAKVYCFEPAPENFKYLLKNVEQNNMGDRVVCINSAVSDSKDRHITLNRNYDSSSSSTFLELIKAKQ